MSSRGETVPGVAADSALRARAWLTRETAGLAEAICPVHAAALEQVLWRLAPNGQPPPPALPADDPGLTYVDPCTAALAAATVPVVNTNLTLLADLPALFSIPGGAARALQQVETATGWGRTPMASSLLAAELFAGAALAAARHFDLLRALRHARAALYAGLPDDEGFRSSFGRFVACLQDDDGSFLRPTDLQPAARGDPRLGFRVMSAVAIHGLWTLSELRDPEFRLAATF